MTRSATDYLVYSCGLCSKRIFTDRSHQGRTGTCPCCGGKHVVGGARVAVEGEERRGARRVPGDRARVGVEAEADLLPLRDLSETGIGFVRKSAVEVGEEIEVTLHAPGVGEGRTYRAEVRRVEADDGTWSVGAQFVDLDPEQQAELRAIVRNLSR